MARGAPVSRVGCYISKRVTGSVVPGRVCVFAQWVSCDPKSKRYLDTTVDFATVIPRRTHSESHNRHCWLSVH